DRSRPRGRAGDRPRARSGDPRAPALMAWYQEWFGEEYLELYAHRDEAEARQQVEFFQGQCGMVRGEVLDLACGMGRHMTILQEAGYRAVGCDLSYTLLRTGMVEYGPMPVARADMRSLPF